MALRIGIIGCGGIARVHWNGWGKLTDRAEVVALCDNVEGQFDWFKQHVPNAKTYTDFNEMIEKEQLDAVDICLPHDLHHPCLMKAIDKGLHWLCEKPLCIALDEAAQIRAAMQDKPIVGMSAHNQTFMPSLLEARRLMDAGELGDIYTIITQDCFIMGLQPPGSLPGTPAWTGVGPGSWRLDKARMGGGELIDSGYHPTYRMLFLAQSKPVQVAAVTGKYRNRQMNAEDTATVVVAFENGVTGTIRTSWALELPNGHSMFHVIGERGELYGGASELFFKPSRFKAPARMAFDDVDTFEAEVKHFVDCIENDKTPVQSYEDGVRVLDVILNAYKFVDDKRGEIK